MHIYLVTGLTSSAIYCRCSESLSINDYHGIKTSNKNVNSSTSGAMYCRVPVNVSVLGQMPANRLLVPKSEILTTPL